MALVLALPGACLPSVSIMIKYTNMHVQFPKCSCMATVGINCACSYYVLQSCRLTLCLPIHDPFNDLFILTPLETTRKHAETKK